VNRRGGHWGSEGAPKERQEQGSKNGRGELLRVFTELDEREEAAKKIRTPKTEGKRRMLSNPEGNPVR